MEGYELSGRMIVTNFICMMMTLPYMLKLSLDIMDIFQSYFAVWDINLVPANLHFNNPLGLSPLGNVDSLILNKEALINGRSRRVKAFRVEGKCYYSEHSASPQVLETNERHRFVAEQSSDSSSSSTERLEINYLPTDAY